MSHRQRQLALLAAVAALAALGLFFPESPAADNTADDDIDPSSRHRALRAALSQGRREVNARARIRNRAMLEVDEAEARLQATGGGGGVCFDDQRRDAWMTSRMICGEDLPPVYGVPGSTSDASIDAEKKDASVAICVIGKTRSFTSPLAQETLRTNLAASFGAGHTAFYFHLFPRDERGTPRPFGVLNSNVQQTLDAALRVMHMNEGDFAKQSHAAGTEDVHHWVSETCGAEIVVDDRDSLEIFEGSMQHYTAPRPIREFSGYFARRGSGASDRGFIAQWTAIKDCHDFVRREEERRGRKFDYVIRTRPDLVYTRSMKPHCMYSSRDTWMQHDWMYVMPRQILDYLRRVYDEGVMAQSNPAFLGTHDDPEEYLFRMLNGDAASRVEYAHDGCCEKTGMQFPRRRGELSPRRNDAVAGAMVLRAHGGDLLVCHFANDFGGSTEECVNMLQLNPYNVPVVHEVSAPPE